MGPTQEVEEKKEVPVLGRTLSKLKEAVLKDVLAELWECVFKHMYRTVHRSKGHLILIFVYT